MTQPGAFHAQVPPTLRAQVRLLLVPLLCILCTLAAAVLTMYPVSRATTVSGQAPSLMVAPPSNPNPRPNPGSNPNANPTVTLTLALTLAVTLTLTLTLAVTLTLTRAVTLTVSLARWPPRSR